LPFSQEENGFVMRNGVCVDGVTPETLRSFCENFLISGTCYLRLRKLVECNLMTGSHMQEGLMFQVSPANFLYHNLCVEIESILLLHSLELEESSAVFKEFTVSA
jgi:hypothetical protein